MNDFVDLILAHKWIAVASVVIGCIVRLIKLDEIPINVPPRWRPMMALLLGQVAAVLDAVANGTPWQDACVKGFAAAVVAIAGHETLIEGMRGGKEIGGR